MNDEKSRGFLIKHISGVELGLLFLRKYVIISFRESVIYLCMKIPNRQDIFIKERIKNG